MAMTPTILGYPENCFEFKTNPERIKRMQKRFEFGTLMPFGDDGRMCLSVAQKSVAIVDIARATILSGFLCAKRKRSLMGISRPDFQILQFPDDLCFFSRKQRQSLRTRQSRAPRTLVLSSGASRSRVMKM